MTAAPTASADRRAPRDDASPSTLVRIRWRIGLSAAERAGARVTPRLHHALLDLVVTTDGLVRAQWTHHDTPATAFERRVPTDAITHGADDDGHRYVSIPEVLQAHEPGYARTPLLGALGLRGGTYRLADMRVARL